MAKVLHAELTYSFRRYAPVVLTSDADSAVLKQVERLLLSAGQAFNERRYNDAIDIYTQARSLLWSQLFPVTRFDEKQATTVDLLKPFISYAAEWLNVLPVEQPHTGIRPRLEVPIWNGPILGLSASVIDEIGSQAAADLDTAHLLTSKGNPKAAKFFSERAERLAPKLVQQIRSADAAAVETNEAAMEVGQPRRLNVTRGPDRVEAPTGGGQLRSPRIGNAVGTNASLALRGSLADESRLVPSIQVPAAVTVEKRAYTARVGNQIKKIEWSAGRAAPVGSLLSKVYEARRELKWLPDVLIRPEREADAAVALAHAWYYETALGLAESYHALQNWADAEQWYVKAANYQFLNAAIEAPYVWSRLAILYADWGDDLFRADDPAAALDVYEKVLTAEGQPGTSALYSINGLTGPANVARALIAKLNGPVDLSISPAISAVIHEIHSQLAKIEGGLDFWGHWAQNVPIWTFDYLQSVAVNFCQLAIGAERDAMTFWEKADSGELTRLQLTQNVALATAEREAAQRQVEASQAELGAYQAAEATAKLRAANAQANAQDYAQKSAQWSMHQALSAQLSGGEDGNASELNSLADRMIQGGYSLSGDRGTLAAAESLTASRLQQQFEIDQMNRQVAELNAARAQAAAEQAAASARVTAMQAAANAAAVRVNGAEQLLVAFDQQRFTPDVWHALGERMNQLAQRYLGMALDVAKRMQRAYNFENDVKRAIIKPDYTSSAVHGMLAADILMADVQSFTYDLITSTTPKSQPIRQTISLSSRYPFLFESQFRTTGRMEFSTSIEDFDMVYPGTYAGRIEHIEVEVDGIIPARGLSGTLTNTGISHYRVPVAAWLPNTSGLKHRIQQRETLVLSDYDLRGDAIVIDQDRRQRRIFEGAGVASSWTLDIPPAINQIDFASIVDVRLTVTYRARFDSGIKTKVLTELANRAALHERQRPVQLRWLFPDAFFSFYNSGVLDFQLDRSDFPAYETDPQIIGLSLLVVTTPAARRQGVKLRLTAPGKAEVSGTSNAAGIIAGGSLSGAVGGNALGAYQVKLDANDNPGWVSNGALALDAIENIALVLEYAFTPRG